MAEASQYELFRGPGMLLRSASFCFQDKIWNVLRIRSRQTFHWRGFWASSLLKSFQLWEQGVMDSLYLGRQRTERVGFFGLLIFRTCKWFEWNRNFFFLCKQDKNHDAHIFGRIAFYEQETIAETSHFTQISVRKLMELLYLCECCFESVILSSM